MRIDSLLNNGPANNSSSNEPFLNHQPAHSAYCQTVLVDERPRVGYPCSSSASTGGIQVGPSAQNTPPSFSSESSSLHLTSQSSAFNSNYALSARSSYSEASGCISTAATSPLEVSMPSLPPERPNTDHSVTRALHAEHSATSTFPERQNSNVLPSFTELLNRPAPISPTAEAAISPRTDIHNQNAVQDIDAGYFVPTHYPGPRHSTAYHSFPQDAFTSHATRTYGVQQRYSDAGASERLTRFCDVALESNTLNGRHNLEMELAASDGLVSPKVATVDTGIPSYGYESFHHIQRRLSDEAIYQEQRLSRMSLREIDPALRPITVHALDRSQSSLFRASPEVSVSGPDLDRRRRSDPISSSTIANGQSSTQNMLDHEPKCSYCAVCTTGSPLRKVVSHIFGRNKLSTRQIPKNVWVYYCRKHYQRSRYRNPRGFARQQVSLVRTQCNRLQVWGGVKDWVIKVRRREEIRMNREGDPSDEVLDENDLDDAPADEEDLSFNEPHSASSSRRSSMANGARRRSSACGNMSNWITAHVGENKSIEDVFQLLDQIDLEVQTNGGKFPDVELLPNVDLALVSAMNGSGPFDIMSDRSGVENKGFTINPSGGGCVAEEDDLCKGKKRARASASASLKPNKKPKGIAEDHFMDDSNRLQSIEPLASTSRAERGSISSTDTIFEAFSDSRQFPTEREPQESMDFSSPGSAIAKSTLEGTYTRDGRKFSSTSRSTRASRRSLSSTIQRHHRYETRRHSEAHTEVIRTGIL